MRARRIAIIAAVGGLVAAGLALPAPAFAAGTGTVTVQLESASGAVLDLAGVSLQIYHRSGDTETYFEAQNSGSTGSTTFANVPSGVHLTITAYENGTYITHQVTDVEVATGKTLTEKITYAKGATISGTAEVGTTPLAGATIALFNSSGAVEHETAANSSGTFTFTGLQTAAYRVQFNSRFYATNLADATDYSWSYWAGSTHPSTTSWSSSKTVSVSSQTSHSSASSVTGINGTVTFGDTFTGNVALWSTPSSHSGATVSFVGSHPANNFSTTLNGDGDISVLLNPGKYRVAISGAFDPVVAQTTMYWYRSDAEGPTLSESKAAWIEVAGNKSVTFIDDEPFALISTATGSHH